MFKIAQVAVVALIALTLAGCSASVPVEKVAASSAPVASAVPVKSAEPTEAPVAAPIEMTAAPSADPATPWGEAGFESADAWYLASIGSVWQGERPADAQLLGAGTLACQQIEGGTAADAVVVVTGDSQDAILNNKNVVGYATTTLCP